MTVPWPSVPLGEVLTERQETPPDDILAEGKIRIIAKIGFGNGEIQLRNDAQTKTGMILIRPGDLVISGINAAKGAIAVYDEENAEPIAATIHYAAYIPNKERVATRYLWWLLRSSAFRDLLLKYLPGGVKTELRAKRLLPIPIPLPPRDEQRRIVARIEELTVLIGEAQALRREAIEEATALNRRTLDYLVSGCTTFRQPLEKLLAEPLLNGLSLPASQMGSGTTFAKVGIVNSGRFDPNETKMADIDLAPDSPYWLRVGDILVSRGNTPDLVGRAAVYEGNPPNCAMPDLLIRIRVNRELADPWFIAAFFHSHEAREYIESQAVGTSPSMKKISQPKLRTMLVPDLPLGEQRRIVAYLDGLQAQVDELAALQDATQAELEALLPSVLDKAFRGKL